MDVHAFLSRAAERDRGPVELVDGLVVAMSPKRSRHVDMKMHAWEMLRNAVRDAGLPCAVKGDGMAVVIDAYNARQPDVSVQCSAIDPEATVLDDPIIVVEVVSPSSERSDTGAKVGEYFRVPSIRHYLIIDPYGREVILHSRRHNEGPIQSHPISAGSIRFDPPGFAVMAEDLLDPSGRR